MIIFGKSIDNRKIKKLIQKYLIDYAWAIMLMLGFLVLWNN